MLDRLDHALRTRPERAAVLTATRTGATRVRATRGELVELADAFAAALHARGLRAGDTVGVAVRPGPRALAVLLALWRLGLRGAVLDPGAGPDVLRARLALAAPSLVLADAAAQAVAGWARPLARRARLALPDLTSLGAPVATVGRRLPGCAPALDLGAARSGVPGQGRPAHGDPDADAVIVFTSGTTSRPRAVVHTRASLAAGMECVCALFGADPARAGDPVLGGTFFVLVPSLTHGAPVALPARSPAVLARQLHRLRPRDTYLTPPQLRDALASGARFRGRVWTGSAPASAELLSRVRGAGAEEAWGVYALTELFPAAAVEAREKAAYEGPGDLVGAPLPGVAAKPDDDGQLLLAGAAARHRYLGEEPEPWVRTGDRGRLDGAGRIVLEGRSKDMVLRRAENIYPGLYEPALHVPGWNWPCWSASRRAAVPSRWATSGWWPSYSRSPGRSSRGCAPPWRGRWSGWAPPDPTPCCSRGSRSPGAPANPTGRRPHRSRRPGWRRGGPGDGFADEGAAARPPSVRTQPPAAVRAARRHARAACTAARGTLLVHGEAAYREALTRLPLDRTAAGTTGGAARAALSGSTDPDAGGGGVLFDQDGSGHRADRRDLAEELGAAGVAQLRTAWQPLLARGLAPLVRGAEVDVVALARELSGAVVCRLLGSDADPAAVATAAAAAAAASVRTHLPGPPRPGARASAARTAHALQQLLAPAPAPATDAPFAGRPARIASGRPPGGPAIGESQAPPGRAPRRCRRRATPRSPAAGGRPPGGRAGAGRTRRSPRWWRWPPSTPPWPRCRGRWRGAPTPVCGTRPRTRCCARGWSTSCCGSRRPRRCCPARRRPTARSAAARSAAATGCCWSPGMRRRRTAATRTPSPRPIRHGPTWCSAPGRTLAPAPAWPVPSWPTPWRPWRRSGRW